MADEEHLKIIRQGVDAWNDWREKNPKLYPDLTRENFRGANLSGANLCGAQLPRHAHLQLRSYKANLNSADLRGLY
jgi:uncharacterized protein YjbI with pentapeptide repeats